jgi:CheY-like chemotaxis protein
MNKPIIDLSGAKILTVDDVPANLDVLSQSLESDG